jgi:hypothetical protein
LELTHSVSNNLPSALASSRLLPVPEYHSNSEDNAGCWPASIQMVMSTQPRLVIPSIAELDRIQEREPGKVVWAFKLSTELAKAKSFDVIRYIGEFDVLHFVSLKQHDKEYADLERPYYDIALLQKHAAEALTTPELKIIEKIPTTNDIRKHINEDHYIVPCINYKILHGEETDGKGPGHFIVLYGYDEKGVYVCDPGEHKPDKSGRETKAERENCHISWECFECAWSPLSEKDRSMTCFRPASRLQGGPLLALDGQK